MFDGGWARWRWRWWGYLELAFVYLSFLVILIIINMDFFIFRVVGLATEIAVTTGGDTIAPIFLGSIGFLLILDILKACIKLLSELSLVLSLRLIQYNLVRSLVTFVKVKQSRERDWATDLKFFHSFDLWGSQCFCLLGAGEVIPTRFGRGLGRMERC